MHIKNSVLLTFLTVFATQCQELTDEDIEILVEKAVKNCRKIPLIDFVKKKSMREGKTILKQNVSAILKTYVNEEFDNITQTKLLKESQYQLKNKLIDDKIDDFEKKKNLIRKEDTYNYLLFIKPLIEKESSDEILQMAEQSFTRGEKKLAKSYFFVAWFWRLGNWDPTKLSFEEIGYIHAYNQTYKNSNTSNS